MLHQYWTLLGGITKDIKYSPALLHSTLARLTFEPFCALALSFKCLASRASGTGTAAPSANFFASEDSAHPSHMGRMLGVFPVIRELGLTV